MLSEFKKNKTCLNNVGRDEVAQEAYVAHLPCECWSRGLGGGPIPL